MNSKKDGQQKEPRVQEFQMMVETWYTPVPRSKT